MKFNIFPDRKFFFKILPNCKKNHCVRGGIVKLLSAMVGEQPYHCYWISVCVVLLETIFNNTSQ